MAMWLFADAIIAGRPIKLFNHGRMRRDFTYVDDVVESIIRLIDHTPQTDPNWTGDKPDPASSAAPWRVYNIGNHSAVELLEVVRLLEEAIGAKAKGELLPICGRQDQHVQPEGREKLHDALAAAGTTFTWHEFNGAHAFMRDEGYRYDPELALQCYRLALDLFHRKLGHGDQTAAASSNKPVETKH